ncbi:MAG: acetyl-CoA C-acetyltransferase [Clostridiales bacterium]|nr:acetyl-CoA C-acetyltransferase [Clostridiales bacterium]
MRRVFIVSACRTPIGKMGGGLSTIGAAELGAKVISEAIDRAGIEPSQVEHVSLGCVIQAALGQNVARQAAIASGIPDTSTALTMNVVCGSGLESVNDAARRILLNEADIVVAGGVENMSAAPFALKNARFGYRMGAPMINSPLIDTMVNDALWDAINDYHMGVTAENVAKKWGLTRDDLDSFSLDSQKKAQNAIENGLFADEIVPVAIKSKKGEILVDKDESPRANLTIEDLAKLKPAFKKDGIVTAGNASSINDGAAAVILISEEKMLELGLTPMAEWIGGTLAGVDPAIMGVGPIYSTRKLLDRLDLNIEDIDLFEMNEAFAAQSIVVKRELGIPSEKLNINGGAIALGHPVGASGCRILVTLLYNMIRNQAQTGLASLCVGGGMGCSVIVKREKQV